jgi:uncharacterized membrane protein YhdT
MDWVYVCALEFLIFNFVGSELAETDRGVADLPAWDNIGCWECNLSSFLGVFQIYGLGLCWLIEILIFMFIGTEMAESALVVADLPAWDNIGCRECNFSSLWGVFRFLDWVYIGALEFGF